MKTARQEILEKLRKSNNPVPEKPNFSEPVFYDVKEPLELAFKENLEKVNGQVHICFSEDELMKQLELFLGSNQEHEVVCNETPIVKKLRHHNIQVIEPVSFDEVLPVGITGCEALIAHSGSVMVSSAQTGGRKLFAFPEIHVVIAEKKQLVKYLEDAYRFIQNKYENLPSQLLLITGPSRTADIEKTLTLGAHGPKELHVFIY